jgi:putative oxidoreductase
LSLILVTTSEFLCALLMMFGLGTRVASALVVISMAVAAFVAHAANPWTSDEGYRLFASGQAKTWASKEPALLYLIPSLALAFTGAGQLSLDELIRRRRRGPQVEREAAGKAASPLP